MKYAIKGAPFSVVELDMEQGETIVCDAGAMAWMTPGLELSTSAGGFGAAMGRMFSGESMFLNYYKATRPAKLTIGSSFPGEIRKIDIGPGNEIILQKSAFLASTPGVEREIFFTRKVTTGVFGGEGFIMNRYFGNGALFIEVDGTPVEYDLEAGQSIVVSSGHVCAMSATCKMDVQSVKGMKNKILGGEGFFNTVVTGPGHVILQTMPVSSLAASLSPYQAN